MENEIVSGQTSGMCGAQRVEVESTHKTSDTIDVVIDILEDLQKMVADGPPKSLRFRLGDKVVAEVPLALATTAALVVGVGAVLLTKLAVDLKRDG